MSTTLVDEKCGCGAEFHWRGDWAPTAMTAASKWREQHQHIEVDRAVMPPPMVAAGIAPPGEPRWHTPADPTAGDGGEGVRDE